MKTRRLYSTDTIYYVIFMYMVPLKDDVFGGVLRVCCAFLFFAVWSAVFMEACEMQILIEVEDDVEHRAAAQRTRVIARARRDLFEMLL